ncbi:MAG: hypothetical protein ACC619_01820, partial [Paracoccaceae bacterium]
MSTHSIAFKFPAAVIALSLIIAGTMALFGYTASRSAELHETGVGLGFFLDTRASNLTMWSMAIEGNLETQAGNPSIRAAMADFSQAWEMANGNPGEVLQNSYAAGAPVAGGTPMAADLNREGSQYDRVHDAIDPYLKQLRAIRNFRDIILLDT